MLSPLWIVNGLKKTTPSAQVEALLTLFVSQQVLACLLGSAQTCGPEVGNTNVIQQNQTS